MLSTSDDDYPPRRNARSFDLDDSATKAAAWVWHLHESKPGISTEGRFLSSQSRRRRNSSSDKKISRFRQEAAESSRTKGDGMKLETPLWDCGSSLYDTFELVSFGDRLDRSLMESVPPAPPPPPPPPPSQAHIIAHEHHMPSPVQEPSRILRAHSLPKSMQGCRQTSWNEKLHASREATDTEYKGSNIDKSSEVSFSGLNQDQVQKRWPSVEKMMKVFKKVVILHKQASINVGCKQSIDVVEPSQRPIEPSIRKDNEILSSSKGSFRSSRELCVGADKLSSMHRTKARRRSLDEDLLSGRRTEGSLPGIANVQIKECSKPQLPTPQNYLHKHLHHHHHHHHHHFLYHSLASESARLSPETLSRICAENGWLT